MGWGWERRTRDKAQTLRVKASEMLNRAQAGAAGASRRWFGKRDAMESELAVMSMRWKGKRPVAVLLGALQLLSACYQYAPVRSTPSVGSQVGFDINDEGRVGLRDQLGPGVARVEGVLTAVEGDVLVVQASSVTQIRGLPMRADSVRVRVSKGYVESIDERRLSRGRTYVVVGVGLAIVAAFLGAKRFGVGPSAKPPKEPPVNQYRGH